MLPSLRHPILRFRPALARGGRALLGRLGLDRRRASPSRTAPEGTDPPRAARARRAVEQLLVLALAASLVAAQLARPAPAPDPAAPDACGPWTSLAVDVATDGPSRLRLLPGLGAVRTRALLDDRARNGPVQTVEGLRRIRGFGAKTVGALRAAGAVVGAARPPPGPAPGLDEGAPAGPVGLAPQAEPQEEAR